MGIDIVGTLWYNASYLSSRRNDAMQTATVDPLSTDKAKIYLEALRIANRFLLLLKNLISAIAEF